jgi:hypothetical protein
VRTWTPADMPRRAVTRLSEDWKEVVARRGPGCRICKLQA